MFDWFKKKEKGPTLRGKDIIWISTTEKWQALPAFATQHQPVVLVCWFQETLEKAKQVLTAAGINITPQLYHSFVESGLQNKTLILLEHYPLLEKESGILSSGSPREIIVLSALDEPLFMLFGGERLKSIMEKMGMAPGETIEHSMITASIKRAQAKISSKVLVDYSARSQEEWFRRSGIEKSE